MQAFTRSRFLKQALAYAALGSVLAGPILAPTAAMAQDDQDQPITAPASADGEIVIPKDVKIFGDDNPNLRRATAVVNGDVITGTDVDQRLALIVAANHGKIPADEMNRLREQILRNLIDETLEIQDAKINDITVDKADIDRTYARVASRNFGQDTDAMDAYLKRIGSSPASLKRQIEAELAWQQVLQRNVAPYVNVSNEEVNEVIARLKAAKGTEEYRIGEIYLSATPENADQVHENAVQIMDQLKKGGSFVAYARQYSQASTAAVGGDLGWIHLAQLPQVLADTAKTMEPGQLVGPVTVPGGYDILYLIDKRQVLTADPRDAVLALKQISITFPKGITEAQASAKAKTFADAIRSAKGCGEVDKVAATVGATVVANDQVKARDLPSSLQDTVLKMQVGQVSPPFGSLKDGVRMLMLCGRDDPPAADNDPNFEQLQSKMEDDRINKRAQLLLRDLRRDAVIEYN